MDRSPAEEHSCLHLHSILNLNYLSCTLSLQLWHFFQNKLVAHGQFQLVDTWKSRGNYLAIETYVGPNTPNWSWTDFCGHMEIIGELINYEINSWGQKPKNGGFKSMYGITKTFVYIMSCLNEDMVPMKSLYRMPFKPAAMVDRANTAVDWHTDHVLHLYYYLNK